MTDPAPDHLVDHLFRNRAGQMVAWLTRIFGAAHLELESHQRAHLGHALDGDRHAT